MFAQESLQKIELYKKLYKECENIEGHLHQIVLQINPKWDKDSTPRVDHIMASLETKLIYERNKLAEIRGE